MTNPQYLNFEKKTISNEKFEIDVFEIFKTYQITIKRFYFLRSESLKNVRGNHAHINQHQIFILISGSAKINVTNENGDIKEFIIKENPLMIPPLHWIELEIQPYSLVLCLATESYSSLKSIVDKSLFLNKTSL